MGRITESDSTNLSYVGKQDRTEILYKYLVEGKTQKVVAEEVYHDYGDYASMRISVVTRGYGFHNGNGCGKYRSIPYSVVRDFVQNYSPEHYDGGLNTGTFDRFVQQYRQQIEAQKQQAEQQRRWEAEEAERRRQQQVENERRQREWEAQQEQRRQQEAEERRRREEAARQEQLRREEAARQERLRQEQLERERQAAFARGDHERLMEEAEQALDAGNFYTARAKTQQAWDIYPMVGLQYLFACCADKLEERADAAKWALEALNSHKDGTPRHLELCKILLNNGTSALRVIPCARELHKYAMLEDLRDEGVRHLAKCMFSMLFTLTGGLRIMDPDLEQDLETLALAEAVARLAAERLPKSANNRRLMLDCAFILTYQGAYSEAYDIYSEYALRANTLYIDDTYDLHANMGWCAYQMGDRNNAFGCWFSGCGMNINQFNGPLDAFVRYNYDEALLDVTGNNPNIRNGLAIATDYLNGVIPGSRYYNRCYSPWQSAIGIEPDEDTRWVCSNGNQWELEIYTPDPSEVLRERAKGFFGKLFGK